jgi:hypothetical protein
MNWYLLHKSKPFHFAIIHFDQQKCSPTLIKLINKIMCILWVQKGRSVDRLRPTQFQELQTLAEICTSIWTLRNSVGFFLQDIIELNKRCFY